MIKWLKKLFGFDTPDTPVIAQETVKESLKSTVSKVIEVESDIPTKPKTKKPTKKKTTSKKKVQDEALNAMTKKELLEVAKIHGIKANASLSKAELVNRVKNG